MYEYVYANSLPDNFLERDVDDERKERIVKFIADNHYCDSKAIDKSSYVNTSHTKNVSLLKELVQEGRIRDARASRNSRGHRWVVVAMNPFDTVPKEIDDFGDKMATLIDLFFQRIQHKYSGGSGSLNLSDYLNLRLLLRKILHDYRDYVHICLLRVMFIWPKDFSKAGPTLMNNLFGIVAKKLVEVYSKLMLIITKYNAEPEERISELSKDLHLSSDFMLKDHYDEFKVLGLEQYAKPVLDMIWQAGAPFYESRMKQTQEFVSSTSTDWYELRKKAEALLESKRKEQERNQGRVPAKQSKTSKKVKIKKS